VSYRIKPKQNLAIGTEIVNTASIYFDFNSPIVTNTTLNTILHDDFAPAVSNEFSFSIYPNPTENQLTVSSRQLSGATISITDILGRELHNEILNQPLQTINLESFSSGVYFISLRSEKFIAVKKIIVE
jgi:hypothetical protein